MRKSKEQQLAQLILDGNVQAIVDVYSSKAFGWISKCITLHPTEVEGVVESLKLNKSDSAAIISHTLQGVLDDIDEHEGYSEDFGSEDEITKKIAELEQKIQLNYHGGWESIYQLTTVLDNGYDNFSMKVRKMTTDEKQLAYLTIFENTKRKDRPEIILNTQDFSFMTPLLDEAILSLLAEACRYGASNFSEPEEREVAEKSFEAFEYYVSNRPLPICFATEIVTQIIQMTARWENHVLAKKVAHYIDKIKANVFTYTSLCGYYATYSDRDKLIETLKLAEEYGADDDNFGWAAWADNPWEADDEVQRLIPQSIFSYPLDG